MTVPAKPMVTNNKVYNTLKYTAQIALPALGTLYFALSEIWGLPNGTEIVGTIVAVNAFLGMLLGINSVAYNKSGARYDGSIDVFETDDTKTFQLNYDEDPYELEKKNEVVFKVNSKDI